MGQILEVTCADCGETEYQGDGPLMTGFQPRCEQCGTLSFVSISNLVETDPPGIDPGGREAWRLRYERVDKLAGTCDCGGKFFFRGADAMSDVSIPQRDVGDDDDSRLTRDTSQGNGRSRLPE